MRIAILGYTATSYGSYTYLKNFLPHLAQFDRDNTYEVFLPAGQAGDLAIKQSNFHWHVGRVAPRSGWLRVLWEQLVLPWILWFKHVDAVYTTHNVAIFLSPVPSLILVQNVEPFFTGKFPSAPRLRPRLLLLRLLSHLSLHRSLRIIAISDWEREFLVEHLRVPSDKIAVACPGVTAGFRPPARESASLLREYLALTPPYMLCVTRLAGYGNLLRLVKAYTLLVKQNKTSIPLVIPGEVWDERYVGTIRQVLEQERCADLVRFLGYVPHRDMPLLIGNATCFVFPSLLEAFGHALLEALACGAPVLCCQRRPMSDICRDAAVYFDGEDPADIAAKLLTVLADPALRERLARKGVMRAAEFSWDTGATTVHKALTELSRFPRSSNRKHDTISSERSV